MVEKSPGEIAYEKHEEFLQEWERPSTEWRCLSEFDQRHWEKLAAEIGNEALEEAAELTDQHGKRLQNEWGLGTEAQECYRLRDKIRALKTPAPEQPK
jgi:hypothetical protein